MPSKRLVVLDGYSLLYRAFYSVRFLSTSDGRPTNALYGFLGMLFYILEKDRPDAVVVALDSPGKTFRHAEYAEYKATRKETADELRSQLRVSREMIAALGIPSVEATGFEADDVVGAISLLGEKNGYDTTIVTGDLDSLQLVDDNVRVMTSRTGVTDVVFYDKEKVFERYGFGPELVPDYKAIVGDTSDNIPGVPGIGEKGATELITQFGTIENLLERWDEVPEKYRKKIEPVREQMKQSKWLATIRRDLPLDYKFEPYKLSANQFEAAKAFLELYELRNPLKRVDVVLGPYREGFETSSPPVQVLEERIEVNLQEERDPGKLRSWVADRPYSILFEATTAQQGMFDEPVQFGYVAVGKDVRQTSDQAALDLFAAAPDRAILHEAKVLYRKRPGLTSPVRFDSLLGGYVLQSGRTNYALRDLVQGYLDLTPPTTMPEMTAALCLLERPMRDRLEKEGQTRILDEIELPLTPILAELEAVGVRVSPDYLREFSKSLEVEIEQVARRIHEQAGQEFNIGSPKQLGEILFEKLQIPGPKKTKTGYATGAEVLQNLAPTHQICADVLQWRELTKLKSTYADALPKLIADDGRIHTTYNQTGAATGRLSSIDPNLQNIPIRTEMGRHIRKAFQAAPGYRLLSCDYSQIELRVLAHLCGDEALIDAFSKHEDVHTVTAALMYGIPNEQVSKDQRRYSKMLNYAVAYGVTDFGLANQLGGEFSVSEARSFIELYFSRFPKIKAYMDGVVAEARAKGFSTTLLGRRRYFPDIHAANRNERMATERQAMNAPIQGAAADMMKLALIGARKHFTGGKSRMLLSVHDEILCELADGEDALIPKVRQAMAEALPLSVPVEVDAKIGDNWDEMTPL